MHLTNSTPGILKPSTAGGTCAIPHDVQLDSSAVLVLCPGVYVFNSGSNLTMNGQSTLLAPPTATTNPAISAACIGDLTGGVTIVFANSGGNPGSPNIGGGATVNITAPTSGATAGIAVFQQRATCSGEPATGAWPPSTASCWTLSLPPPNARGNFCPSSSRGQTLAPQAAWTAGFRR